MKTDLYKTIWQALVGMLVVFATFIAGTIVCEFFILGTMNRYLTPNGEWLVGMFIFLVSLTLWSIARWKTSALFLASGFTAGSVVLVFIFYCDGISMVANRFANAHWGMLADLFLVWRHTAIPVFCSALCLKAMKRYRLL